MFPLFRFSIQEFFIYYFYRQKWPLYMNFSIPHCGNLLFSQGSTPCVSMRFCGHLPNSPKNKNLKRHISYLLEKVVFLDSKRLLSPSGRGKKNFFFNFECYDLANGMECKYKIWQAYRQTLKLATRSYGWKYQNCFQFYTIHLAFNRICLEAVLTKNTLTP